jgi:cysteine synthase
MDVSDAGINIGNTPLVRRSVPNTTVVLAKLGGNNPAGSVKTGRRCR